MKPPHLDLSPSKAIGVVPASSSPPPVAGKSPAGSPTRDGREQTMDASTSVDLEEDGGFDLTKYVLELNISALPPTLTSVLTR